VQVGDTMFGLRLVEARCIAVCVAVCVDADVQARA